MTELIVWLFFTTNTVRLFAYAPQIVAAWKCDAGAKSVSLMTWGFFMFSHFTSLLYGIFVVSDNRMVFVFAGNFLATALLCAILVFKRISIRRQVGKTLRASVSV